MGVSEVKDRRVRVMDHDAIGPWLPQVVVLSHWVVNPEYWPRTAPGRSGQDHMASSHRAIFLRPHHQDPRAVVAPLLDRFARYVMKCRCRMRGHYYLAVYLDCTYIEVLLAGFRVASA